MSNRLSVYCTNLGRYIGITGGDTPLDIYRHFRDEIPFRPVVARINNKSEDLNFPFFSPKTSSSCRPTLRRANAPMFAPCA